MQLAKQEPTTADEVRERARVVQRRLREQRIRPLPPVIPDPIADHAEPKPPDTPQALRPRSIANLQRIIAQRYGISVPLLVSGARVQHIARARQVGMYIARVALHHSFPEIGRRFGRDYSTAIYAYTKITECVGCDFTLAAEIESITREMGGESCPCP